MPQYRENLTLAVPVMLSQVGQVVVQLADNAMVGRLGALPLAGVSFGGAVFVIFMFWGMGVSLGLTPLVGEAYAKRDLRGAAALFQNSLVLYAATGIVLLALLLGLEALMDRMGQAPEVVAQARPYFRYLSWSIVPFMMYCAFKQFLEGVGNTSAAMVVMLTSNAINIGFNYLLIYGKCGFPEMGAAGAGLATLISRICMPLMMLAYFLRDVSFRRYLRFVTWAAQGWRRIRQLLSVGLPISVQMVLEVSAFALSSIMMGWIGAVELAAHQIVVTFGNFAFMAMVGISSATTILVSHRFGRGDLDDLSRAATASFSDGLQVVLLGVLRGMQDVKIVMRYAFVSYIVINLPVGYLCAFTLGMGAPGLWVGFIFGLGVAALLYWRRYRRLIRRIRAEVG